MKFAVMFGNRGFFPGELVATAINDFKLKQKDAAAVAEKRGKYLAYAYFAGVAEEKIDAIARLGVAFDTLIERFSLDAIAVRVHQLPRLRD